MLRLTLEIVPKGLEEAKRTIGVMEIANVTDDFDLADPFGNYKFNFTTEETRVDGKIDEWPRKLSVWKLVQACLQMVQGPMPLDHFDRTYNHGGIRKRKKLGLPRKAER